MRINYRTPQAIDPSVIEIGDDISVELPADKGLVTTLRGIVAKRHDHGSTRYLMTAEGATILAWEARKRVGAPKVTIYGREEHPQAMLFEANIGEMRERLTG